MYQGLAPGSVLTEFVLDWIAAIEEYSVHVHGRPDSDSSSVCVNHGIVVEKFSSLSGSAFNEFSLSIWRQPAQTL